MESTTHLTTDFKKQIMEYIKALFTGEYDYDSAQEITYEEEELIREIKQEIKQELKEEIKQELKEKMFGKDDPPYKGTCQYDYCCM